VHWPHDTSSRWGASGSPPSPVRGQPRGQDRFAGFGRPCPNWDATTCLDRRHPSPGRVGTTAMERLIAEHPRRRRRVHRIDLMAQGAVAGVATTRPDRSRRPSQSWGSTIAGRAGLRSTAHHGAAAGGGHDGRDGPAAPPADRQPATPITTVIFEQPWSSPVRVAGRRRWPNRGVMNHLFVDSRAYRGAGRARIRAPEGSSNIAAKAGRDQCRGYPDGGVIRKLGIPGATCGWTSRRAIAR